MTEVRRHVPLVERWRLAVHDPQSRELLNGCEAFLAGRFIEHQGVYGRPVPVWAWTNLLAHGTESELRRVSNRPRRPRGVAHGRPWSAAQAAAAGEVLLEAERRGSLTVLQQSVLIPLELRLGADGVVALWSPNRWLEEVISALDPTRRASSRYLGLW